MKIVQFHHIGVLLCMTVLLMFSLVDRASGLSATLPLYDGFDLESSTMEGDPTVLVIFVGNTDARKHPCFS